MSKFTRNKIFLTLGILFLITLSLGIFTHGVASVIFSILTILVFGLGVRAIMDVMQTRHSLLRNYPLIGRIRWIFEDERAKIQQYFVESDTSGTPYNKEHRSDTYQKSKLDINTVPFGTQLNVYTQGYEYIQHSLYPKNVKDVQDLRFTIGGRYCKKPYSASRFNISAMSYGALSDAAIRALNGGAKLGNFYHNTGEGGLSPYHLENGGDICFQIGTGYFGAGVTIDGVRYFDEEAFLKNALLEQVKMIEIKLSQGAKPGHGGILPASKNTNEIAKIRGVEPNVDVVSPAYHTAFSNNIEMLQFIKRLRNITGGKPIGIKLCLGNPQEFDLLVKDMVANRITPDFITIDGGEGGTGAAPLVFTNHIGNPLLDGLSMVTKTLVKYNLRKEIKVIASGKASTSFDIIKLIALGADGINAARAFMFSLGCIQARECNKNTCPVGVATQDKFLSNGLNVEDKKVRVYNYHHKVTEEVKDVLAAMGIVNMNDLKPSHIFVRMDNLEVKSYDQLAIPFFEKA